MFRRGIHRRGGSPGDDGDKIVHDVKVKLSDYDHRSVQEPVETSAAPLKPDVDAPQKSVAKDIPKGYKELTPLEIEDVTKRAASIQSQSDDESTFRMRDASLKAPKTGDIVAVPFPPPESHAPETVLTAADLQKLAQADAPPLTVERFSPTGNVDVTSAISVTFNQPMIELSSVDEIAKNQKNNILTVSPPSIADSRIVWKGTNTVQLEVNSGLGRFPKSTKYTASVPMETTSVLSGKLEKPFSFSFTTATLAFYRLLPSGVVKSLDPIILAEFNQKIDPEAIIKFIKVSASKNSIAGTVGKALMGAAYVLESGFTLVSKAELEKDESLKSYVPQLKEQHWIAFKCPQSLPKHSVITVAVKADAPSAEGPLRTPSAIERTFQTYPPFLLRETYPKEKCEPSSQWSFYFTTVIDKTSFQKDMVTIKPAVSSFSVQVSGATVVISQQNAKPNTHYTISFDTVGMKDVHGQLIEGSSSGSVSVGEERKYGNLSAPRDHIVLDPAVQNPYFEINVQGYEQIALEYYHMDPTQMYALTRNFYTWTRNKSKAFLPIGTLKHTEVIHPNLKQNVSTPVKIPVRKYLQHPTELLGQIVVLAYPTEKAWTTIHHHGLLDKVTGPKFSESRPVTFTWVQSTRLALDVVVSPSQHNAEAIAWVTRLVDGKPAPKAEVTYHQTAVAVGNVTIEKPEVTDIKPMTREKETQAIACPKGHTLVCQLPPGTGVERPWTCSAKLRLCKNQGTNACYSCTECKFCACSVCYTNVARGKSVLSNADGLAVVHMASGTPGSNGAAGTVVATLGNDVAFCLSNNFSHPVAPGFATHIINDRGLYRPKETVTIKGYIRRLEHNGALTTPKYYANGKVDYNFRDSRSAQIKSGSVQTNEFGAFDLQLALPDNMNLGSANVTFIVEKESFTHSFRVEEFRRPEYECKANMKPLEGHISATGDKGGFAIANVKASYFSGGPLSDAAAKWTVTVTRSDYAPPGWNQYSFGQIRNWWDAPSGDSDALVTQNHSGTTNPDGEHELRIEYSGNVQKPNPQPLRLQAQCSVVDLNNQAINSSTSCTLHPSAYYIGVKMDGKSYLNAGETVKAKVIVTDHEGHLVPNVSVAVEARRSYHAEVVDAQGVSRWENKIDKSSSTITSLPSDPVVYSFTPNDGGSFSFAFSVTDTMGRANQTVSPSIFVQGVGAVASDSLTTQVLQPRQLVLVPGKQEFDGLTDKEGEVMIQSQLAPAEGLLLIETRCVVYSKRFQLTSNVQTEKFPLNAAWAPNAQIRVILNGSEARGKPRLTYVTCSKDHPLAEMVPMEYEGGRWKCDVCNTDAAAGSASNHCAHCSFDLCRACFQKKASALEPGADPKKDPVPAMATAVCAMKISLHHRKLDVKVTPSAQSYRPGAEASVAVEVQQASGSAQPNSEVAIIVVDEAVLSLTGHQLKNPLEAFYLTKANHVTTSAQRSNVVLLTSLHDALPEEVTGGDDENLEGGEGDSTSEDLGGLLQQQQQRQKKKSRHLRRASEEEEGGGGAREAERSEPLSAKSFSARGLIGGFAAPAPAMMRMSRSSSASAKGGAFPDTESSSAAAVIAVRSNFAALAHFAASVKANANGTCSVQFKLPDSLTRYRVWAIAVTDVSYGLGESVVSVQLPLEVRPSWPRFLNVGDRAEASVVLVNQLASDQSISVVLRCSNAQLKSFSANQYTANAVGYLVPVKPNGRASLTFSVETKRAGTARFQIIALSQGHADASEIDVPVFTPATTEAFATYGDIGDEEKIKIAVQQIKPPKDVYVEFGGLELSTSTTILSSLTDAVLDLLGYPFDCSEQLSSRTLGVVGLKDILAAFKSKELPSEAKIHLQMTRDMSDLVHRQYSNGGFSFWRPMSWSEPSPYVSAHVTHAVARAKANGIAVNEPMLQKALSFCKGMDSYVSSRLYANYGKQTKLSLVSYAIYARARATDKGADEDAAAYLAKHGVEAFALEAIGWLLGAMLCNQPKDQPIKSKKISDSVDQIQKHIRNKVNETAETAHFITSYGDDGQLVMLHSDRRTDAILLESVVLLTANANWPGATALRSLVPKLVRGLLAHRTRGKFKNTQENCFVLLAMDAYFKNWEKTTPDFVARVWLGETWCGQQEYKGRSVDTSQLNVPMQTLHKQLADAHVDTLPMILQKEGVGRLYYRIGLRYAPADLQLKAASYGFKVSREYIALPEPGEKEPPKDAITTDSSGAIHVKLGSTIRVRLTMVTPSRRYHVALVDKLPAGFEALNPALKGSPIPTGVTASSSKEDDKFSWLRFRWYDPVNWFEHQNLRDERAEAFKSLLWQGVYQYEYLVRATTAGQFVVPPAKAEEMYSPEIFGRSSTNIVIVE